MNAYDEFCGCGEYACTKCFGGERPADAVTDNAWLDAALSEADARFIVKLEHRKREAK